MLNRLNRRKIVLAAVASTLLLQGFLRAEGSAPQIETFESYLDIGYNQKYRPQFHFTSRKNPLNDPNGMVYYDGEYHLFFQHNPSINKVRCKIWGHAVSKDMVHWEQLPHAILPYDGGLIFSGTGAVDHPNTLGKQKGETKTLLACFTFA
jgi:fructan beta-fructosidase